MKRAADIGDFVEPQNIAHQKMAGTPRLAINPRIKDERDGVAKRVLPISFQALSASPCLVVVAFALLGAPYFFGVVDLVAGLRWTSV